MFNQIGLDTVYLTGHYTTTVKMINKEGLRLTNAKRNTPITKTINTMLKSFEHDHKRRYNKEQFTPVVEVAHIINKKSKKNIGKTISSYVVVIRFIPLLFDLATHHKKSKGEFCLIVFTGLHQPNSIIKSESMKVFSKFSKRKTFKVYDYDIAIDHQTDTAPIDYKRKEAFKSQLMPYSTNGVFKPPNGATTLFINKPNHPIISKMSLYDKFIKETKHHKKKLDKKFEHWKRLEFTIKFDVTNKNNKGFTHYLESLNFLNDLHDVDEVARLAKIKNYDTDYLIYQINSLLDNRFMNNHESKKQFNSVESLERFKQSDFIRYTLP